VAAIVVRDAVLALPPRQRAAIVARYFGQLSETETADVLGCAEGTVRALTAQGVASLRRNGNLIDEDQEVTTDAEPR
jgi:RNA polymerase sigma factor (sigma-70 family)